MSKVSDFIGQSKVKLTVDDALYFYIVYIMCILCVYYMYIMCILCVYYMYIMCILCVYYVYIRIMHVNTCMLLHMHVGTIEGTTLAKINLE